jgi:hypothetical protein
MQKNLIKKLLITFSIMILFLNSQLFSQNIKIDNFESYPSKDSLSTAWRAFGFSTLDFDIDSADAPIGKRNLSYTYSGNDQTTWGGAVEKTDLASNPLDLSSTPGGLEFYLKGDGTSNNIYVRISNGTSNWSSNKIPVSDTTWHAVYIPYVVDTLNGFSNGTLTDADLMTDLANVTDFRIYIDHPQIDNISYKIYFDEIYSVKHLPPQNSIMLEDWETYKNRDSLNIAWQFFGYSTQDFTVLSDPANAASGFKYIDYVYVGDNQTTWGGAMRTRNLTPVDISGKKGIQFYLKGDGSPNNFSFRFYNGNEMWSSYTTPLSDTTWHLITIPFIVDTSRGFRYLGNNPDNPVIGPDIGTNDMLKTDLANVTQVRFYVYHPVIDFVHYTLFVDGLYAVDEFPPLAPVPVDNFESYSNSSDLNSTWQLFGDASVALTLTSNQDSVAEGNNAAVIKYDAVPGTQFTLIRRNNIIPGLNFSNLSGGLQFWLKGDGSNNKINIRLFNGNEMWGSNSFSLKSTVWSHVGIPFVVDSMSGFRYLGNDPQNPVWSGNLGTQEQLMGDLANIDQIFFEIRNPEQNSTTYSVVLDNIEGVDKLSSDVILTSVPQNGNTAVIKKFQLSQNYPNPFNPSTIIRYELPKSEVVTLTVYNLLGQRIVQLINQRQNEGIHEVTFNDVNLSSGVYFYTLKAGKFISTKKMLLLK